MKVVILAGGKGTRIRELSKNVPKPLIKIAEKPLIEYVIDIYQANGFSEFIICGGYLVDQLKQYFITNRNDRNILVVDTGLETQTAGRLKRIQKHLCDGEPFCVTYGDGIANVNLTELIVQHNKSGCLATLTSVQPYLKYGRLQIEPNGRISSFEEKPKSHDWINCGFMILESAILNFISNDEDVLETDILPQVALEGQLHAFKHHGHFHAIDTFKEYLEFTKLIESGALEDDC